MSKAQQREKIESLLSELTFGLEVEQTGIGRWNGQCLRQINQAYSGRERWSQVSDCSIAGNGSEFVSGIMNWSSIEKVQESVRTIRRSGGRAHESCGIHVHIDGGRFIRNPKALVRLIRIVNRYERHIFHAVRADGLDGGQNRMNGRWANPMKASFVEKIEELPKNPTIQQIREAWNYSCSGRYRLFNLNALWSKGTIEFRCFNSTLHAGKIRAYIYLCGMICARAIVMSRAKAGKRTFNPETGHYEVRTWLIDLGAVGEKYANMRKHLTSHLKGDASWHRTHRNA